VAGLSWPQPSPVRMLAPVSLAGRWMVAAASLPCRGRYRVDVLTARVVHDHAGACLVNTVDTDV
jgi:hypothetical protein